MTSSTSLFFKYQQPNFNLLQLSIKYRPLSNTNTKFIDSNLYFCSIRKHTQLKVLVFLHGIIDVFRHIAHLFMDCSKLYSDTYQCLFLDEFSVKFNEILLKFVKENRPEVLLSKHSEILNYITKLRLVVRTTCPLDASLLSFG